MFCRQGDAQLAGVSRRSTPWQERASIRIDQDSVGSRGHWVSPLLVRFDMCESLIWHEGRGIKAGVAVRTMPGTRQ